MTLRYPCLFALCLVILNSNALAQQSLSLQDCLSLARENNPKLIRLKTAIEQSRAGVTAAYSSYYPSINLSNGYSNKYGAVENHSTSIGVTYPFYQGGYIRAGVKLAKARVKMAEENYRLGEDEVSLAVKEAFFRILQKQEQVALAENICKRRKEDLVLIRLKYSAGRESLPAVKEAEANLLQAEYDKHKQKRN